MRCRSKAGWSALALLLCSIAWPGAGKATIIGSVFYNSTVDFNTPARINLIVNAVTGGSPAGVIVLNLGGIFVDSPLPTVGPTDITPFCGNPEAGAPLSSCPGATLQSKFNPATHQDTVTLAPPPSPPYSFSTFTSHGSEHNGYSINGGSNKNPKQLLENPGNVEEFLSVENPLTGKTATVVYGAITPVLTTIARPTEYLVVRTVTGDGLEQWTEIPAGPGYSLSFHDYFGTPISFSSASVDLSLTQIPLGDLNPVNFPGAFTPVPVPPILRPQPPPIPEPGSIALLVVGLLGVGVLGRRRAQ